MPTITRGELPAHALLHRYAQGAYTDCFYMDAPDAVGMSDYVAAFYTSRVFRLERALLGLLARRPATDQDAQALAHATASRFSVWVVEDRTPDQLLLRDTLWQTRSWLMVAPLHDQPGSVRLYFGSAVIPKSRTPNGTPSFGRLFHAMTGFHLWYTKALMRAAYARLPLKRS